MQILLCVWLVLLVGSRHVSVPFNIVVYDVLCGFSGLFSVWRRAFFSVVPGQCGFLHRGIVGPGLETKTLWALLLVSVVGRKGFQKS